MGLITVLFLGNVALLVALVLYADLILALLGIALPVDAAVVAILDPEGKYVNP